MADVKTGTRIGKVIPREDYDVHAALCGGLGRTDFAVAKSSPRAVVPTRPNEDFDVGTIIPIITNLNLPRSP